MLNKALHLFTDGSTITSRHIQAIMAFLAAVVSYSLRVNAFVAIVAVTSQKTSNPQIPV